jgi:integrase
MVWVVRVGKGPRTRLRAAYGSPEFLAAYHAAISSPTAVKPRKPGEGTFAWLWELYRQSPAWAELSPATKKQRENLMKLALERAGDQPLEVWTRKFIIAGRDARSKTPAASANFLKTLRSLFRWAVDVEHIDVDPTANVKALKQRTEGHHTWTVDEMSAFESRWPTGTRERLAYDVLVWTGLRRGDASRLGPRHVRDGEITITTEKTGRVVALPVLKPLADSIAATPIGHESFVACLDGSPMVKEGFGNWFADACKAAGVPGRAHGLRKALSVKVAEHGATDAELDALLGWSGGGMASLYTRKASRQKLAASALSRLGIST